MELLADNDGDAFHSASLPGAQRAELVLAKAGKRVLKAAKRVLHGGGEDHPEVVSGFCVTPAATAASTAASTSTTSTRARSICTTSKQR